MQPSVIEKTCVWYPIIAMLWESLGGEDMEVSFWFSKSEYDEMWFFKSFGILIMSSPLLQCEMGVTDQWCTLWHQKTSSDKLHSITYHLKMFQYIVMMFLNSYFDIISICMEKCFETLLHITEDKDTLTLMWPGEKLHKNQHQFSIWKLRTATLTVVSWQRTNRQELNSIAEDERILSNTGQT